MDQNECFEGLRKFFFLILLESLWAWFKQGLASWPTRVTKLGELNPTSSQVYSPFLYFIWNYSIALNELAWSFPTHPQRWLTTTSSFFLCLEVAHPHSLPPLSLKVSFFLCDMGLGSSGIGVGFWWGWGWVMVGVISGVDGVAFWNAYSLTKNDFGITFL